MSGLIARYQWFSITQYHRRLLAATLLLSWGAFSYSQGELPPTETADITDSAKPTVAVEQPVPTPDGEGGDTSLDIDQNSRQNTDISADKATMSNAEQGGGKAGSKEGSQPTGQQGNTEPVAAPIFSSTQIVKRPQAKSVELDEPVISPALVPQENVIAPVVEALPEIEPGSSVESSVEPQSPRMSSEPVPIEPLIILGTEVLPSTSTRLSWSPSQSFEGIATPTPILIVNGAMPGPTLCLTAALHGDELNGIETVRRVLYNLQPEGLSGTVIGVPIVNLQGFRRSSRYLTDRRDLNRHFPGNPQGSSASRIAYSFFTEVISHCNALVDLHTGSFHRTNLPQLRADISNPQVVELTQGFGSTVVLQSAGAIGTLRRAAVDAGIPAVTLEAGESMRLQEVAVEHAVKGIRTLMNQMGMTKKFSFWGEPEPVYYNSVWVRADRGGILFSNVELGDRVNSGDLLGVVTDPITNIKNDIVSPNDGRVIGMALNQVVLPGFAAFHVGIRAPDTLIPEPEKINPSQPEPIVGEADHEAGEVQVKDKLTATTADAADADTVASEATAPETVTPLSKALVVKNQKVKKQAPNEAPSQEALSKGSESEAGFVGHQNIEAQAGTVSPSKSAVIYDGQNGSDEMDNDVMGSKQSEADEYD